MKQDFPSSHPAVAGFHRRSGRLAAAAAVGIAAACFGCKPSPGPTTTSAESKDALSTTGVDTPALASTASTIDIDGLEAAGVVVKQTGQRVTQLDFRGATPDAELIDAVEQSPDLTHVRFAPAWNAVLDGDVAQRLLRSLAQQKSLKVLAIDGLRLGDSPTARVLVQLPNLVELYAGQSDVGQECVAAIAAMPLRKLRLSATQIDGRNVETLSTIASLIEIDCSGCRRLRDDLGPSLEKMSRLEKLNLYDTGIGDNTVRRGIATLANLRWLNLDRTAITDASLSSLAQLPSLTFAHLGSTAITDSAVDPLASITAIERLIVTRTHMTSEGAERLRSALPSTQVDWAPKP